MFTQALRMSASILMMLFLISVPVFMGLDKSLGQNQSKKQIPTQAELDRRLEQISSHCVFELKRINDSIEIKNQILSKKLESKARYSSQKSIKTPTIIATPTK